ncbi:MAG: hypothetical protein ABIH80_03140 [Methanobacteriota archaeon]
MSRKMIAGVITVRMVANALLCNRGRSHNVLLEAGYKPYKFQGHCIQPKDSGRRAITLTGKADQCVPSRASGGRRHVCQRTGIRGFPLQKGNLDEKSDESIVAMIIKPMIYRTCIAGCRGRRYEEITQFSKGILGWQSQGEQHDNIEGKQKPER